MWVHQIRRSVNSFGRSIQIYSSYHWHPRLPLFSDHCSYQRHSSHTDLPVCRHIFPSVWLQRWNACSPSWRHTHKKGPRHVPHYQGIWFQNVRHRSPISLRHPPMDNWKRVNLLPNWTLLPILTLLPNFGGFHRTLQRVRLANRGRLLLRTPGPVQFGTCICSNVETIFPELVMSTDLLSFEHPSVLLFCFETWWFWF